MTGVVITGLGLLTPLGVGREQLPAALAGETSGIGTGALGGGGQRLAQVADIPVKDLIRSPHLRRMDRLGRMSLVASVLALRDAGLPDTAEDGAERFAVGWSTEFASIDQTWAFQDRVRLKGPRMANPMVFPNLVQNAVAGYLSIIHGLKGPSMTFCHHEVCGLEALGWAARTVAAGRADRALVGVTEEIGEVLVSARSLFGIGEAHGEGAVALVLESASAAAERGAPALARVAGEAAVSRALPPYRYAPPEILGEALDRARQRAGESGRGARRVLGLEDDLAGVYGASATLPLLHLAALVDGGVLPSAVAARARGGACRAIALAAPEPPGGAAP